MRGDRRVLLVGPNEAGERLDQLVAKASPHLSRSRVQQLLAGGHITIDGAAARASRRCKEGERVLVEVPAPRAAERLVPQALPLRVLHQDASMVVVDKPAGMTVHPAPGNPDGTLVNALLHHVTDLGGIGGELRPGIVHRLDKDTSGVMVVAKTEEALTKLQAQFKARTVEKTYLAIVHGVPGEEQGVLEQALARHPRDRKRFTGRWAAQSRGARAAVTLYRVLEWYDGAALVEARPKTGRTHQIRVHLSEAGHPLLGEEVYGGTRREGPRASQAIKRAAKALGRHALHALRLEIDHPTTGERMTFEAPVPEEWALAVGLLRGEQGAARPEC